MAYYGHGTNVRRQDLSQFSHVRDRAASAVAVGGAPEEAGLQDLQLLQLLSLLPAGQHPGRQAVRPVVTLVLGHKQPTAAGRTHHHHIGHVRQVREDALQPQAVPSKRAKRVS